ncbi:MAG: hypothetical protein IT209_07010 [Armatimonadetes bacterium]|nr:hypothetical protein [Armatimonadota bacterium]
MKCARHPKVDTELTCTVCGTPICPDCAVPAAVGFKCPRCARPDRTVYDIPPPLLIRCIAATLATSVAAWMFAPMIPFFGAIIVGYAVGHVALVSSGRRAGSTVEAVAVVSILIGLFGPAIMSAIAAGGSANFLAVFGPGNIWSYIGAAIAIFVALGRLRYP